MKFKLTFWRAVFLVIMVLGLYSTYIRYFRGLGAVSNMTDQFPWGLWIGFDCLCGVMLAAGGFCMVGAVYLFNVERLHTVVRPAVLTAFLGYLLFIVGLMFDLGRPWFIWHQIIYMNPHSVMFEVGMCVMIYTTVLFFEFLPNVFERFNWKTPIKWIKKIYPVLIVLRHSALHAAPEFARIALSDYAEQAASVLVHAGPAILLLCLGGCGGLGDDDFRVHAERKGIRPAPRTSAFWSRSAAPCWLRSGSMLCCVSRITSIAACWGRSSSPATKLISCGSSWCWRLSFRSPCSASRRSGYRRNGLYLASVFTVLGFITNRLNIALIGFETYVGHHYVPKWTEFSDHADDHRDGLRPVRAGGEVLADLSRGRTRAETASPSRDRSRSFRRRC